MERLLRLGLGVLAVAIVAAALVGCERKPELVYCSLGESGALLPVLSLDENEKQICELVFDGLVNKTTWEGVEITGTVDEDGPLTKFADIGIPVNSEEGMYVVIEDSAGGSDIAVHPDSTQVTQLQDYKAWNIDLSTLTGVDLTRVQKLTIGLGKKAAPVNNGEGTMFIDDIRLNVAQ